MPQWIHDRAKHILAKNKGMPMSEAFALATQQSHALGKSPKSYGTVRGREEAADKYKTPEDDQKTAASVRIQHFGDIPSGIDAIRFNQHGIDQTPVLKPLQRHEGQSILALRPVEQHKEKLRNSPLAAHLTPSQLDTAAEAQYSSLRRHELTHHIRERAGKMEGVGKPGLRNVAKTFREEGAAYMSGLKPFFDKKKGVHPIAKVLAAQNVPAGVVHSAKFTYAPSGGVLHNALGGTLKPLQPYADKARSLVGKLVKRGEFKLQGSMEHQGIPIAIENRKGSVRKGVDKDGNPWRTKMVHPYGYIKGSKGADGEEVDAYVGPHEEATHAYVVHQRKSDGKGYDEDKVMLGFPSKDDAVKGYLKHYNSDKFLGPVKEVPVDRLKEMLMSKKKLVKISGDACVDELSKLGAITEEQANSALDRYETLERQKPTAGQVGRYAALGAVAGPGSHIVSNLARGRGVKGAIDVAHDAAGKAMSHGRLRTVAGTAAAGALATGAIPLLRTHLDRNAERKTLRKYIAQRPLEKDSGSSGITPAKPWAANESADLGKYGASATPMGTFSAAKRVGLPRVTNVSGPSIASQVGGHGRVLPGAGKGGIGKGGVSIGSSGSVM